jgi:hypothetical protein
MATKGSQEKDLDEGKKGRMTVEEAGHLGGEAGGHKGGQRVKELIEKGKAVEEEGPRSKRRS